MSVANFVAASIDEFHLGRYDVALSLACCAIDATSAMSASHPSMGNNKRFKLFVEQNMRVITTFGFPGIVADGIRIKCINVPDLKTDNEGYVSIADIIYHALRCSLVHECSIDERIDFTEQTYIGDFNQNFRVPKNLIFGLLMAVIISPCNASEIFNKTYLKKFGSETVNLQDMWGRGSDYLLNM
jgi:hypothetical protein